jgi:hypothetical protein
LESTLSLAYADLLGEVGLFLGYGRGAAFGDPPWSTPMQNAIESCVRSGLRQFYFPTAVEGGSPYDWSFLKPVATLSLAATKTTLPLPDDYGSFEGQITISTPAGNQYWPVNLVGIGQVYAAQARKPTTTGRPEICCEEPVKGTSPTQGQRFQLRFWPAADTAYTLQFQYYLLPEALSGSSPFTYGGMAHAETILESCLAIAEQRLDDSSTVHSMKFQERLLASIGVDRRSKPQTLGYNRDQSDCFNRGRNRVYGQNGITYKGVQY